MGPLTVEQAYFEKGTKPVQGVQVQQIQGTELYWIYGWKCIFFMDLNLCQFLVDAFSNITLKDSSEQSGLMSTVKILYKLWLLDNGYQF